MIKRIREMCGKKTIIAEEQPKFDLGFVVLWLGTKCTLKCKACANMIPFAEQRLYDINKSISNLKNLLKYADIKKLQIQGGEPFLHKDITKVINVIDELDIPEVLITTNGTVELSEDVIKALKNVKNPNFFVNVSDYKCVQKQQVKFVEKLESEHIPFQYYKFKDGDGMWRDYGNVSTPMNEDDVAVQEIFNKCDTKWCNTLADGKLYRCGRAVITEEYFKLCLEEGKDFIFVNSLTDETGIEKLRKYYYNKDFPLYCRFCLGATEPVVPGEQIR